jgi:hypothetical protein
MDQLLLNLKLLGMRDRDLTKLPEYVKQSRRRAECRSR